MSYPESADILTSSDEYALRFHGPVGEWFLRMQGQAILQMLESQSNATVLDVGGGHGQLVGPLAEAGYRVTVFGSSEECKARIQQWLDTGRADFRAGNILQMQFPDRSYDVVISLRLLAHVNRWQEFLAELARVANKAVIVDYPEVRSFNYFAPYFIHLKKLLEADTREFACYRRKELVRVFAEFGFRPAACYPQYFLPMALHRKLGLPRLSRAAEAVFRATGMTHFFGSPVILKVERICGEQTDFSLNPKSSYPKCGTELPLQHETG